MLCCCYFAIYYLFIREVPFRVFWNQNAAFELVGGVLLVYVAFTMLANSKNSFLYSEDTEDKENIAFMPMTFPLLVGPAAMSSVIIQSDQITAWQAKLIFIGEFFVIGILIGVTLKLSKVILKKQSKIVTIIHA